VPFAAIAPMIVVSCAIGAFAIQNAMFDVWLMLLFGVVGYVFKKIGIPLAPFTLALVLGNRAEDAFRLSMIGAGSTMITSWWDRSSLRAKTNSASRSSSITSSTDSACWVTNSRQTNRDCASRATKWRT